MHRRFREKETGDIMESKGDNILNKKKRMEELVELLNRARRSL